MHVVCEGSDCTQSCWSLKSTSYLLLHDSGTAVAALSGRNEPISTLWAGSIHTTWTVHTSILTQEPLCRVQLQCWNGEMASELYELWWLSLILRPPCPAHSQAPARLFTACTATDEKLGRGLGTRLYQDHSPLPYNTRRVWLVPGWSVGGALLSRVARMW